jgi:xanthine/CO dehydrogenase XdhC/CoxF family maturation factor
MSIAKRTVFPEITTVVTYGRPRPWAALHPECDVPPLLGLFEKERLLHRPLVLGVLTDTAGSTYRKAGALILIASSGEYVGMLTGGCLESDLVARACKVLASGLAAEVEYDLRGPDELIWGLGTGCAGLLRILLLPLNPSNGYQPLSHFARALKRGLPTAVGLVCRSACIDLPLGAVILPSRATSHSRQIELKLPQLRQLLARGATESKGLQLHSAHNFELAVLPLSLPPRLLLLGAGPDAVPVVEFAARLGWSVTVVDHRPAYAIHQHFPNANAVAHATLGMLDRVVRFSEFSAAVIMSHSFAADLSYLATLAGSKIPFIGLLGPCARRDRLLSEIGSSAAQLLRRLHAPVGLRLGGRSPESVALSIAAELHAFLHAKEEPFRSAYLPTTKWPRTQHQHCDQRDATPA